MSQRRSPGNTVADAILAAQTDQERREIANAYAAYGLAVLAAMDGDQAAAEAGYRLSDALASRNGDR
jgi:hypothetical protein